MLVVDTKAIKKHIADAGLKQGYIAERSGMTVNQLSACFNGRRELKASEYANLCKALNVSFKFFLRSADKVS